MSSVSHDRELIRIQTFFILLTQTNSCEKNGGSYGFFFKEFLLLLFFSINCEVLFFCIKL